MVEADTLRTSDQFTEAERVVRDADACEHWFVELNNAYREQRAGTVQWNVTADDVRLYERYMLWAQYRRYRFFWDQNPEKSGPPGPAPTCTDPGTGPMGDGPRYSHAFEDDPIRFLLNRKNRASVDPRYSPRRPQYRTAREAMAALDESMEGLTSLVYEPIVHTDASDNAQRRKLQAQVDARRNEARFCGPDVA